MSERTQRIKPEFIIFNLDLIKDTISTKKLNKALQQFIAKKEEFNMTTVFSFFFFKKGFDPFLSKESKLSGGSEFIEKTLEMWEKERETSESRFENGLFYCLSEITQKAAKLQSVFRIIILSDTPSQRGSPYVEAMMGLVENVRVLPTFIDIIRIGDKQLYSDDVQLSLISRVTSGGVFTVKKDKDLKNILTGLSQNKRYEDLLSSQGEEATLDQKKYYENLAESLVGIDDLEEVDEDIICCLCMEETCPKCEDHSDVVGLCPECGYGYHECCSAEHSWRFNIGLKHLFRCVNCGCLIKLDEANTYAINGEEFVDLEQIVEGKKKKERAEKKKRADEEKKKKSEEERKIKDAENKKVADEEKKIAEQKKLEEEKENKRLERQKKIEEKAKKPQMRGGGLFGGAPKVTAGKKKKLPQKSDKPTTPEKKESDGGDVLAQLRARRKKSAGSTIKYCPYCSGRIKGAFRQCPHCKSYI